MRKPVFVALLALGPLGAAAQQPPATTPTPVANQAAPNSAIGARAESLSTRMVRDLHLNGYQAEHTRQINLDYITKLADIERKQAQNPDEYTRQLAALNQARNKQLQAIYSSDQYTDFFDSRSRYTRLDHEYVTKTSAAAAPHPSQSTPQTAHTSQVPGAAAKATPTCK